MKLYTVQYNNSTRDDAGEERDQDRLVRLDCGRHQGVQRQLRSTVPSIRIVTLPKGRDEMAAWLNERGVKV